MNIIFLLFRCSLTLLLGYAFFVSAYISFFKNQQHDSLTWFLVLTLLLLFIISTKQTHSLLKLNNIKKSFHSNRKNIIIVFVLCFISLMIGFFNTYTQYSRGCTIAELGQFDTHLSQDLIEASYRQQQPPLDYYFSSFSHSLFGESKFALRFHAMFFYLILSFMIPLGLYFFCHSFWITIIGSILFLMNHVIRLHAVDARPLNLALLTGFLFLFFYLYCCRRNRPEDKPFLPILTSQYLFVMSAGLQPVIFIISLFLSSFWLLLENKKQVFKSLFLSNVGAGLLTLPFYIKMWGFGKSAYKFQRISLESINSYFENLNITYFIKKYFFIFYEQMSFSFLFIVICLIIIWFFKKTIEKRILMLLSAIILFPIFYDSIFNIGFVWIALSNWYIITFSLLLILFFILSLKEINKHLTAKKWKAFFICSFFAIFLWNTYLQISAIKNETRFRFPYRDNSVQQIYDYLKKHGDSKDVVIEFSLTPIVTYRPKHISDRSMLFYNRNLHPIIINFRIDFTEIPPFFYEDSSDKIYYVDWKTIQKKEIHKIFFIVLEKSFNDEGYNTLSSFIEESWRGGEYVIFQWNISSQNREEEYKQLLSKMNKKITKKYRGVLYETLLYYAYKNKEREKFDHLLQEYRAIESALDEFIPQFNYPSRFELRRRVKYFESLDWSASNNKSIRVPEKSQKSGLLYEIFKQFQKICKSLERKYIPGNSFSSALSYLTPQDFELKIKNKEESL